MTQQSFDQALYVAGSDTSKAAAEDIRESKVALRTRVLNALVVCGGGLTDEEIQDLLAMNPSTERPRRVELVNAGLVVDSGEKRKTSSGRAAVVWKVKD